VILPVASGLILVDENEAAKPATPSTQAVTPASTVSALATGWNVMFALDALFDGMVREKATAASTTMTEVAARTVWPVPVIYAGIVCCLVPPVLG